MKEPLRIAETRVLAEGRPLSLTVDEKNVSVAGRRLLHIADQVLMLEDGPLRAEYHARTGEVRTRGGFHATWDGYTCWLHRVGEEQASFIVHRVREDPLTLEVLLAGIGVQVTIYG